MNREIPGMIEVSGREFFYIETVAGEGFSDVIGKAMAFSPELPLPKYGGVIEEKVRLILCEGRSLLGISYKGDVEGWRSKFVAFCDAMHREWGVASREKVRFSDGTERALADCNFVFED